MIIIIGPSASGKTSIAKELSTKYGFKKFVTSTTRMPRKGEINGVDYNFLTEDTFNKKIENNDFIEYTFYNGNHYGSEKKLIDDNTVIIIESNGLKAFKKLNLNNVYSYLLKVDEESCVERMNNRGDSKEAIRERIINDKYKFNDDLLEYVDKIIDTKNKSIDEIANEIYLDYKKRLK